VIEFFQHFKPFVIGLSVCTPRLLTALLIAPFLNTDMITGTTRRSIVLALTLILFPTMLPFIRGHEISVGLVFAIVLKEAVIGALMGYLAGLFVHTIAAVGYLIDHQRGASFASMMDPATGSQSTPMASLFTQMIITLFFVSGGFMLFLSGMYESFRVWPIDTFWPRFDPAFMRFFLSKLDEVFALAFLLASPLIIALFLSELGLGLINRFAPQLNVFFLSMPVKSAVALAILLFYLQFLLMFIRNGFIQRCDIFSMLRQVVH
jgi:type III secretion protein T